MTKSPKGILEHKMIIKVVHESKYTRITKTMRKTKQWLLTNYKATIIK